MEEIKWIKSRVTSMPPLSKIWKPTKLPIIAYNTRIEMAKSHFPFDGNQLRGKSHFFANHRGRRMENTGIARNPNSKPLIIISVESSLPPDREAIWLLIAMIIVNRMKINKAYRKRLLSFLVFPDIRHCSPLYCEWIRLNIFYIATKPLSILTVRLSYAYCNILLRRSRFFT